jgi:hypothetical protein
VTVGGWGNLASIELTTEAVDPNCGRVESLETARKAPDEVSGRVGLELGSEPAEKPKDPGTQSEQSERRDLTSVNVGLFWIQASSRNYSGFLVKQNLFIFIFEISSETIPRN